MGGWKWWWGSEVEVPVIRFAMGGARAGLPPRFGGSFSPRDSLPTFRRMSLPFDTTRCLTFSPNPDADISGLRSGGFRRANSGSERGGIQCGEYGSGILVDDSEQRAGRRFRAPSPSLPVLDSVQAEPERVRKSGLCHAESISDRFHVNFLGHMCLESFLLPSEESLNVVQATHHPLELRFHAISRRSRKYYRPVSLVCCALPSTDFLFHSSKKQQ